MKVIIFIITIGIFLALGTVHAEAQIFRGIKVKPELQAFYVTANDLDSVSLKLKTDTETQVISTLEASSDLFGEGILAYIENSELIFVLEGTDRIVAKSSIDQKLSIHKVINNYNVATFNITADPDLVAYKRKFFENLDLDMVLREDWGAPSSSTWSPYVAKVNRIVVHHTVTDENSDPYASVQTIYNFHYHRCANNTGSYNPNDENCDETHELWQDIGYNYLIAKNGQIFEGRAGGNGSVGAHAIPNTGSIGIAMLGTFTNETPSSAAVSSLTKLTAYLAKLNSFSPDWQSSFFGHRDFSATACPGNSFYLNLNAIAANANTQINSNDYLNLACNLAIVKAGEEVSANPNIVTLTFSGELPTNTRKKIHARGRQIGNAFYHENDLIVVIRKEMLTQVLNEFYTFNRYLEIGYPNEYSLY